MPYRNPVDTLDIASHQFSVLFVDPKPRFLEWLNEFATSNRIEARRFYSQEENTVVLLPNPGYFNSVEEFDRLINEFKPRLLQLNLERFQATEADLGYPITAESFDLLFDCFLREAPYLFTDFKDV